MNEQAVETKTAQQPAGRKPTGGKGARRKAAANRGKAEVSLQAQVKSWLAMSRDDLDALYKKAKPGAVPQGDTIGTAILAGGPFARVFAKLARSLAWQGKVFDLFGPNYDTGVVVNKVTPAGLNLIVAKVYRDKSWMDGEDTIVIDYSQTSLLARQIRDEIREISPGLYLGKVWFGKRRVLDFALETREPEQA